MDKTPNISEQCEFISLLLPKSGLEPFLFWLFEGVSLTAVGPYTKIRRSILSLLFIIVVVSKF